MGAEPFDQKHLEVVVDRDDQHVIVSLDVEYDSFGGEDACRTVLAFQLGRGFPFGLRGFRVPGIQMVLHNFLKLAVYPVPNEAAKCAPCDDSHPRILARSHCGSKSKVM